MRRFLLIVAVALAVVVAVWSIVARPWSGAAPHPSTAPRHYTPPPSLGWLPAFMASPARSPADLMAAARENAVIVAGATALGPAAVRLHRAEPHVQLLAYGNAVTTWRSTLPDSWYARDWRGQRIFDPTWRTWLMDPSNRGWARFQVSRCQLVLARFPGLDGCFLDQEGAAALVPGYDHMTGTPINPASGQGWTPAGWVAATRAIGQRVKAVTGKVVIVNGLADGPTYDAGASALLAGVDGGEAEGWLRGPLDPSTSFPTVAVWKQNVDMIAQAEAHGSAIYAVTKVWSGGTPAQIDQWRDFAWCSFLLAQGPRSRFYFTTSYGQDMTLAGPRPPGSPTTAYSAQPNGLYTRTYTGGTVMVNPTNAPLTTRIRSRLYRLPGHTGMITASTSRRSSG
jgi:hypothetical protein